MNALRWFFLLVLTILILAVLCGCNPPSTRTVPTTLQSGRIFFVSDRDGRDDVFVMEQDGSQPVNITNNPADYDYAPAWSPGGAQVAFTSSRDWDSWPWPPQIWIMDADGGNPTRLTSDDAFNEYPCWSPDGNRLAFMSNRDGNWEIYIMDLDGSNQRNLTKNSAKDHSPDWAISPDMYRQ